MEYFVIYDLNDNLICYVDNFIELKKFMPNYRDRDIRRRFVKSNFNFINIIIDNVIYKVYKFN